MSPCFLPLWLQSRQNLGTIGDCFKACRDWGLIKSLAVTPISEPLCLWRHLGSLDQTWCPRLQNIKFEGRRHMETDKASTPTVPLGWNKGMWAFEGKA
jgi:hypothetical protein